MTARPSPAEGLRAMAVSLRPRRALAHEWIVATYAALWLGLLFLGVQLESPVLRTLSGVFYFGIGLAAVWTLSHVARQPAWNIRTRRAWGLLAVAGATLIVNGALWSIRLAMHPGADAPVWSEWLAIAFQPLACVAFLTFPRSARVSLRKRRVLLDALLLAVGGLALAWYFSYRPEIQYRLTPFTPRELSVVVGEWIVVASACVAYVRVTHPATRIAIALSMLAEVVFVVADYALNQRGDAYRLGDWVDALYFGAWVLRWSGARWAWRSGLTSPPTPPTPTVSRAAPATAELTPYSSGLAPTAFVAGAFALLLFAVLVDASASRDDRVGIAVVVSLMTGLLVARHATELLETRRQLAALDAQHGRFRSVIERATDYIFLVDSAGGVRWASPSARRAFPGSDSAGLVELVHPDDRPALQAWLPSPGQSMTSQPVTLRLRRADAVWEFVELRAQDLRDNPGVAGLVVNGRDRTAEFTLEGKVRHLEKLATLHEMAGRIAHSFNNVLAVVQGHAELLSDDSARGAAWTADVAAIRAAAARGAVITQQLLGFSGRKAIQPAALDVSAAIAEMIPVWKRMLPANVGVQRTDGATNAFVLMDRAQFEQVLFNLVVNARDAMPGGGEIDIAVAVRREGPETTLGSRRVAVSVTDSGMGMSGEHAAHIFDPFFTTKAPGKGTGLGLAMVKTIVSRAGGEIEVRSAPAEGSTIAIVLPAVRPAPDAPAPRRAPAPEAGTIPHGASGVVLLVDDDEAVRGVSERLLTQAGFQVIAVGTGAEALDLASDAGRHIDLLVTDMMMPGMSGRVLIERVVKLRPTLPIICITGFTADDDARSVLPEQVLCVIEKPFTASDLIGVARQAIVRA